MSQVAMKDIRDYVLPEDAERMFLAAQNEKERLLLKLLWHSGRRISEVVGEKGITRSDIEVEPGMVRFNILKKKEQTIKLKPIPEDLIKEILVFCDKEGIKPTDKIWPEDRFWAFRVFRKTAQKAVIKEAGGRLPHPHSFRHSFAVRAVKVSTKPSDLRALQDILEHKELKTTEVYMQHNPQEAVDLMKKMEKKVDDAPRQDN